jgi:protein angel
LRKDFLSQRAGLTKMCQQVNVVQRQLAALTLSQDQQRLLMEPLTGDVHHSFPFVSVYNHVSSNGEAEFTTHHKKASCTVDYIFYLAQNREVDPSTGKVQRITEGPLKLLSSLTLPSCTAMSNLGILPNDIVSSDHVMLMAKFGLSKR